MYKNFIKGFSLDNCKSCPPGQYCQRPDQVNPKDVCAGGWYCSGGSWTDKPTGNEIYNGTWTCPLYNIGKISPSFKLLYLCRFCAFNLPFTFKMLSIQNSKEFLISRNLCHGMFESISRFFFRIN